MSNQIEPTPTRDEPSAAHETITTYDATPPKRRPWIKAVTLGVAGLIAGGVAATTLSASADETTAQSTTRIAQVADDSAGRSQQLGPAEEALTGDTKKKVEAAVLADYPDATIERTETDRGGVYESHITTADGEALTVLVDAKFTVTGTQTGRGGPGDDHGHGMGDTPPADAPAPPVDGTTPDAGTTDSTTSTNSTTTDG